jgi:hypothetical protein
VRDWSSLDEWWREAGEAELQLMLWSAWDPIGCVPRDEYDWYVPRLWGVLREHAMALREPAGYEQLPEADREEWATRANASEQRVAVQLSDWRTERMGLPPDRRADEVMARKLSDWLSPPGFGEFRPSDLAA